MNFKLKSVFLLVLIVILSIFLRGYKLGEIPAGLNRDEAAIGFTAFSLWQTGSDEYGEKFPISFKSFGDWKLPLYIYASILPVASLGLNQSSVRLLSLFAGVLSIVPAFFIAKKVFQGSVRAALLTAFMLSITPWHIHFSRIASEANLAVLFVSMGAVIYLYCSFSFKWLMIASIFFGLSLFTYHANHIFTPLLFLFLLLNLKKGKNTALIFALPFLVLALIIFSKTLFSADKTKLSGLSFFADRYSFYEKTDLLRLEHSADFRVARLFHNKATYVIGRFTEGFLKSLSPEFLVIKGGSNSQHNIPNFGNLYIWEYPLLFAGIYFIFRQKLPFRLLLIFWLLVAILPSAITRDSPHSARMFPVMPLLALFTTAGIKVLRGRFFPLVLTLIMSFSLLTYLDQYFLHFPLNSDRMWGGGYRRLVETVGKYQPIYREIVIDRPENSPYIYFLFYNKTDPGYYQKNVVRYPDDQEGFQHVKSLDNLKFKKLDWANDLLIPGRLLISFVDSTPPHATQGAFLVDEIILERLNREYHTDFGLSINDIVTSRVVETISLRDNQPYIHIIKIAKQNGIQN